MSTPKEPHYFSLGLMQPLPPQLIDHPSRTVATLSEYRALFNKAGQCSAIGEASTSYLDDPAAPVRIQATLGNIKIVVILRDPAERAMSHFRYNKRYFTEEAATFTEALGLEQQRQRQGLQFRFGYLEKGMYHQQLQRYLASFPREQLKILFLEDLASKPQQVLREIYTFLAVDPHFTADVSVKYNVTGVWRTPLVAGLARRWQPLVKFLQCRLPPSLVSRLGKVVMVPANTDSDLRRRLIGLYRENINNLETLLGRDLSHWRT